ncbi:hypothetical protein MBSD_n0985 [Mizugakiibacter sediminis]|uniref:Lipid/polyisoprenoid-binding YceI-like domain-containing protein n=1 Tax=Mizugakiibacter sediminis TaxID=1475481 RepID=A0A0K8QLG8_9GAMM|nr:YceI family protein [Mizugakiibacter sediminis]GAP65694.1 hypothetical protein MBSD_n0985 [Mizugakiibacter sediminis]
MSVRALLLPLLFAAAPALAPASYVLDSERSTAAFNLHALWVFDVAGAFDGVHGEVRTDPETGTARVDAWLDTASLRMRDPRYDDWARSPDFFDVERYPRITFHSEAFPLDKLHHGGVLTGMLVLHGFSGPVDLRLQPSACAPLAAPDCPLRVRGEISRSAFGMRSHRAMLSDTVRLDLAIVVRPAEDAPAAAPAPAGSAAPPAPASSVAPATAASSG